MTCPFCQSAINPGATVCAHCGATEVATRPTGRVMALGCLLPIAATFAIYVVYLVLSGGRTHGAVTGLELLAMVLIPGAWVLGLILAIRVPKKPVWVRRVG